MSLSLEIEDIYFITGLSRRREVVNLRSHGPGGGLNIEKYIALYFLLNTKKVGIQILKKLVQNLGLKSILFALGRIMGLASLHQASSPMMFYFVEYTRTMIYD